MEQTPCGGGRAEHITDDQFTFPNDDDIDFRVRIDGKEIGHLLPGHIVNPHGSYRGGTSLGGHIRREINTHRVMAFGGGGYSGGAGRGGFDPSHGWVNGFGSWSPSSYNFAPGPGSLNALGLRGVTGGLFDRENPYNPSIVSPSRCWCPGGGLGLPCCPTDTYVGGHFDRIPCPGDICQKLY